MARGRYICNTLKAIRKQIADANGIDYSPEECHFNGECKGTCPKCEQDVRDLGMSCDVDRPQERLSRLQVLQQDLSSWRLVLMGNHKETTKIHLQDCRQPCMKTQ